MKEEFLIKLLQKQTALTDTQILTLLTQNFSVCYDVKVQRNLTNSASELNIQFLNYKEVKKRTEGMIELCKYFIRAFAGNQEIDRFQYFQRVLDYRQENNKETESFLIIKYQTNLKHLFKRYFRYLNQLFPILDLLIYIEEVEDGFHLFFEREYDFREYLYNITSVSSLKFMIESKNLTLPKDYFQQMVKVVNRKLMIS